MTVPPLPSATGLGVDLVQVSRFRARQDDSRFLERLFTASELAAISDGPHRAARLAARWAAKEACAKALGCGFGELLSWRDIEVIRTGNTPPTLMLTPEATKRHGDPTFLLSLSHDGDYAIAVVLLTGRAHEPTWNQIP